MQTIEIKCLEESKVCTFADIELGKYFIHNEILFIKVDQFNKAENTAIKYNSVKCKDGRAVWFQSYEKAEKVTKIEINYSKE